ncbi:MAG TPA: TldD/PmbA family protein [Propionibacterium sp.]|jgi:TldD protein|nr:TldD/PmbA family protein [Propionibacterium sp.]
MPEFDAQFIDMPLQALSDAALQRTADLGTRHADVRIERIRTGAHALRDGALERSVDDVTLGMAVRVIHEGSWGFAAGITLTPDAAVALAEQAVTTAKVSAALTSGRVELAPEPVYAQATWIGPCDRNPFKVPEAERIGRLRELSARLLASDGVDHADARVTFVQENTFYADLAGSSITQQRIWVDPEFTALSVSDAGFSSMRTLAPPTGRGWEALTGAGWDFDAEIAELPELLAEHVKAPSVDPGRYDLVIDPTNLWLTIHESVAHATELDRALGYEAAYAGTSFATPDQLGLLRYGSELMNVTGDRVTPHGLATIGWDDEGVAAQTFDIVRGGVLVGFQLNRQMAAEQGLPRSNGCAYADSPGHFPLQRMPNVSLQPAPDGPSTEELIGQVSDGIYVVGDKSWSIDMQRYNFQFTGQRFFRIRNGRLDGQVRDVAYQATTTDFWRSLRALGGPQTWLLHGAPNCGKGQPGQLAPVSHGCPSALFTGVNVLNTRTDGGRA